MESNLCAIVEKHHGFLGDGYQMWLFRNSLDLPDGRIHIVKEIILTEIEVGQMRPAPDPSLSLSQVSAVKLMDSLWQAGIRPSAATIMASDERSAYNQIVAAQKEHIGDLRAIVFNRLAIEEGR